MNVCSIFHLATKSATRLIVKPILFFLLCGAFFKPFLTTAHANEEYSFDWLDPDKKIYVLQNRKYLKAKRLFLSGMGGLGLSGTYRNSMNAEARMAYYFSETWGIEGFSTFVFNTANNAADALSESSPNSFPVVREVKNQFGGLVHWAPWYAKINVFNSILYFDWYFSGGLGSIQTELQTRAGSTSTATTTTDESKMAYFLGTGHHYHLSESWVVRLDFMGAFYRAKSFGTRGVEAWFSNFNVNLGLSLKL